LCGFAAAISLIVCAGDANAQSMKVIATGFSDVSLGTLLNFQATTRSAQSLCVYANSNGSRYGVTAAGNGPGGSFVLYDGAKTLTYGVEWSSLSGQASGTSVTANTTLSGQSSTANNQNCTGGGASTTATLIVAIRPSDLSPAIQGNYSGTLFVTVSAE
jgi:hypothetical protein